MAAARLGYKAHILTPEPDSPAQQVSHGITLGDYEDPAALRDFAAHCDVITFEFENVSDRGAGFAGFAEAGASPSPAVLRISQDRIAEKSFLNGIGVPTAPWRPVESFAELEAAVAELGLPAILKTTRLGYDGRGQTRLRTTDDLAPAYAALLPRPLILEGVVDFACEISVVAARGRRWWVFRLRHGGKSAPATTSSRPDAGPGANRRGHGGNRAGSGTAGGRGAGSGRAAGAGIVCRGRWPGARQRDRPPAAQFRPLDPRCLPVQPVRPAHPRRRRAALAGGDAAFGRGDENLVGPAETALWPTIVATPGLIAHLYGKAEARPGRKMGHVTRLFPRGSLPGEFGVAAALGVLAEER